MRERQLAGEQRTRKNEEVEGWEGNTKEFKLSPKGNGEPPKGYEQGNNIIADNEQGNNIMADNIY